MAFDFEPQVSVSALEPTSPLRTHRKLDVKRVLKRGFDILFSTLALIALSPVFAVVTLMLRLREPGPVFFSHERVGIDGRTFRCHKFRTMREDGDRRLQWVFAIDPIAREQWDAEQKLDRDPRVHSLGDLLRRTSIDELPQFWNVFKGDMSIVGPRPITMAEAEKYGHHFADYCSVKPGITGAWQVGGRSDTSYAQRVVLDVDYIRNASLVDDIQIVYKTVGVVLAQRGAC